MLLNSSLIKTKGSILSFFIILLVILNSGDCLIESDDSLTKQEIELVSKFRPLVKDIIYKDFMNEDEYLVRFLRVRNYNFDEAKEMIISAMKWRKENNIDTILTEDFSEIEKEYPFVFEGYDNYGRPIMFGNIGVVDVRKIVLSGRLPKFLRFFDACLELAENVLREIKLQTGSTNITRAYFWVDLSGFNLRQHACVQCLQLIPRIFTTYENYYPDRIYRFYTVNTPRVFLPIFELIRPFISAQSAAAIELFGYDSENWKKVLASEIPQDQLSTMYGGSRQVKYQTLAQLRHSNPFIKAAFEKATDQLKKKSSNS